MTSINLGSDPLPEIPRRPVGAESSQAFSLYDEWMGVRANTIDLIASLSEEDLIVSATAETSPMKWHLAHTTWFFEQFILKQAIPKYQEFDPAFSYLFNSYYESLGEFLPKSKRALLSRPSMKEVLTYRSVIEARMAEISDWTPFEMIAAIGINHEQQHQELMLMDLKRSFFENPLRPAFQPAHADYFGANSTAPLKWICFEGGKIEIGVPLDFQGFAYDCERDRHSVWVEPFEISNRLVSVKEYLEFVESDGYSRPEFWLSDGWKWVRDQHVEAPLYWLRADDQWRVFTLQGVAPLRADEPVAHVSYYEADAYAKFRKARLATEAEWEYASTFGGVGDFLEGGSLHPNVPRPRTSDTSNTLLQMHGTLWEWTCSAYLPYPRYRPFEHGLAEYNEKFMCNQMVLRGGSVVTPRSHYRPTYRNFYYPHDRWQFSGIRLVNGQ